MCATPQTNAIIKTSNMSPDFSDQSGERDGGSPQREEVIAKRIEILIPEDVDKQINDFSPKEPPKAPLRRQFTSPKNKKLPNPLDNL